MVRFAREDRLREDEDMIRSLLNRIEILEEKLNMIAKSKQDEQQNNEQIMNEWFNGEEDGK